MNQLLHHLEQFFAEMEHTYMTGDAGVGYLPTGLDQLDAATGGLEPGLHALLGRPRCGTTALAHQLVLNASLGHARSSALVTLGETAVRHVERMVARLTAIPVASLRRCDLTPDDWFFLSSAVANLAGAPLELVEAFGGNLPDPIDVLPPGPSPGVVVYDSIDRLDSCPDVASLRASAVAANLAVVLVVRATQLAPAMVSLCDSILHLQIDGSGPRLLPRLHRRTGSALAPIPMAIRPGTWDVVEVGAGARPTGELPQLPF